MLSLMMVSVCKKKIIKQKSFQCNPCLIMYKRSRIKYNNEGWYNASQQIREKIITRDFNGADSD